jgi:hypothetical protein
LSLISHTFLKAGAWQPPKGYVSNNIQQAADKKQADTKTYRVCNNGRNVSVQWYPNKQAIADKVSSPEQLCNTLCAVKGQGECEGQGDQRICSVRLHPKHAICGRSRGGSYYEVIEHKNSPCHVYFDLDRHDTKFGYRVIRPFPTCFETFLRVGEVPHAHEGGNQCQSQLSPRWSSVMQAVAAQDINTCQGGYRS